MPTSDESRLRSLASMARSLARSAPLETILELATAEILPALGADSVSISRLEPGTWTLRTLINAGSLSDCEERWPRAELYPLEDFAHFSSVFQRGETWISSVEHPGGDPADVALLHTLGKGSALTAPLIVDGTLWGELYGSWYSPRGAYGASNTAYIEAVTSILGAAISRSLDAASLKALAFTDPLTGLANRRGLDLSAQQAFADAENSAGRRISVAAIDINDLKRVNDDFGHEEGDRLIVEVGRRIERHFGPLYGSLAARVGGDEFNVLVPGHPVPAITAAADCVCLEAAMLGAGGGVSVGVASVFVRSTAGAQRDLFSAADRAMYEAKRSRAPSAVLAGPVIASDVGPG